MFSQLERTIQTKTINIRIPIIIIHTIIIKLSLNCLLKCLYFVNPYVFFISSFLSFNKLEQIATNDDFCCLLHIGKTKISISRGKNNKINILLFSFPTSKHNFRMNFLDFVKIQFSTFFERTVFPFVCLWI